MILDEKKLEEIRRRVQHYLQEGIIKTKKPKEQVEFFLKNAEDSVNCALCLYDISTNKEYQERIGYPDLRGFLWVINAGYYSMFYNVRALLEHEGIKIQSDFMRELLMRSCTSFTSLGSSRRNSLNIIH